MKQVLLKFKEVRLSGYRVSIGRGLLGKLGGELKRLFPKSDPFLISSPKVYRLWGKALEASLKRAGYAKPARHLVPDGEAHKNFKEFEAALQTLARFGEGQKRRPLVLLLGGGVIGDLGGFAAASYKRGLPFVQIPSTLLSMVDSSVGGKLGIDFKTPRGLIKNLVGSFAQPAAVFVDPGLLESLEERQLASGFAELVKTAVLFDPKLFELLEAKAEALKKLQEPALSRAIASSLAHKAKVVMADEFDRHGKRILLNLGHTFGHAIEAASHLQLLHGEAVAIGLCCAIDLSAKLGLAEPELMRIPPLLERLGLPISLKRQPLEPLMRALREDKKFEGGMRFVLPRRLGRSEIRELKDSSLVERIFQARFEP